MMQKVTDMLNKQKYGVLSWSIDKSDYKEFKSYEEATSWGMEHYQEWGKSYKKNMYAAESAISNSILVSSIECYCGYSFSHINKYLRYDNTDDYSVYREMANVLAIVLCGAPRIPCDIVVYRLVCDDFIKELIENNKNDLPIPTLEKGFVSTGLLKDIVNEKESYTRHKNLLKIYVKKNSIGIYVNSVAKRSEQEILLLPKGYFCLIDYPYKDHSINKMVYECNLFYFGF